jgi:hypothetical protein
MDGRELRFKKRIDLLKNTEPMTDRAGPLVPMIFVPLPVTHSAISLQ